VGPALHGSPETLGTDEGAACCDLAGDNPVHCFLMPKRWIATRRAQRVAVSALRFILPQTHSDANQWPEHGLRREASTYRFGFRSNYQLENREAEKRLEKNFALFAIYINSL
jgi:hypothetical protein